MALYEHFRKEERPFVEQASEWKEQVETRYESKLTDFLDPREQDILRSIIGNDEVVKLEFFGGPQGSERKRALLFPFYEAPEQDQFHIRIYELDYPVKFVSVGHRDVLGSMLGLGVKREKFGDIILQAQRIQIAVAEEIASFVEMNFTKVASASIQLHSVSLEEAIPVREEWEEVSTTVSSLRLDVLLAEMFRLSRSKVVPYIDGKRVKVNWRIADQPSFLVNEGDYLSVRGLGRRKLLTVEGKSKKDKWRVSYGKKQDPS
ncbi:RNA-binding protein [Thalassorhabdus alkalitolerans]|uniref:RNA-binding protein n=1 Tax=Thalassorhabdus alkalitolerans TaxID=2282697 RepID=A0ABW0YKN6_9BACI